MKRYNTIREITEPVSGIENLGEIIIMAFVVYWRLIKKGFRFLTCMGQ